MLHKEVDSGCQRFNRKHRFLGTRRWDDALQKHTGAEVEQPWQPKAKDLELWFRLDKSFVPECFAKAIRWN